MVESTGGEYLILEAGDLYKKANSPWIETFSGIRFYLDDPEFSHADIAHTLSMNCRYNGHCNKFYSVAEHSMLVSALVDELGGNEQQMLEALLHDATEAYLTDVPAPFKQLLPDWQKIDKALEVKFRSWMGFPEVKAEIVKEADWLALFIEAYELLPDRGESFHGPEGMRNKALGYREQGWKLFNFDPATAERAFLECWEALAVG